MADRQVQATADLTIANMLSMPRMTPAESSAAFSRPMLWEFTMRMIFQILLS